METKNPTDNCGTESYLRLAKPRKKGLMGILSLIFSRFFVIVLVILLQLGIIFAGVFLMDEYVPHFLILETIFVVVILIYVFNNSMDPMAKLSWMFFLAALPVVSGLFLLFTQMNAGQRGLAKQSAKMVEMTKKAIPQSPEVWERLANDPCGTDDLVTWLNRSGCFPIYDRTDVTFFPLGEKKFEAMLEELRKAEDYIFMEYFIIEEGYMWGKILEILIEKVKAGVDVRVMYDGMCEITQLPSNYTQLLRQRGIKAKSYAPIIPLLSSHYNYRDHRKILVIDGRVAFNGGVNLGDEYINREERFGHWKDTAVMIKGPAVRSFTLMFLQMWNLSEKEAVFGEYLKGMLPEEPIPENLRNRLESPDAGPEELRDRLVPPDIAPEELTKSLAAMDAVPAERTCDDDAAPAERIHEDTGAPEELRNRLVPPDAAPEELTRSLTAPDADPEAAAHEDTATAEGTGEDARAPAGFVLPYSDCPLDEDKAGEMVYMDILNRANTYVHIMTPYLILDGQLTLALKYAAQRGIDVKLILPGIPDKKMAYALAKSHYRELTRAGVKIYEYTPGFVHAKIFVSDDIKAVVGTINLDYRSLYHHFECATYLYQTDCISDIEADFQETLSKCRQVTEETIRNEKLFYRVAGRAMKFLAPLM